MDPYSLKRDNRKKFQDKQRLKQRHETPSDRKYRVLNRQEQQAATEQTNQENQDEEVKEPPSNHYRYHEDVTMTFGDPAEEERNIAATRKVRTILNEKAKEDKEEDILHQTQNHAASLTTKSLLSMDVDHLNRLLGDRSKPISSPPSQTSEKLRVRTTSRQTTEKQVNQDSCKINKSNVPDELQSSQDFLDDLI